MAELGLSLYDDFLQRVLFLEHDVEDGLVADGYRHLLISHIGNLQFVLRILDLHREVTVDVGLRIRNVTVVGIDFHNVTHHHWAFHVVDGTRDACTLCHSCSTQDAAYRQ